jgi:hypothetical protein
MESNTSYCINEDAYTFELIQNENRLFDNNIVNATYVIYLEGNGRYGHILEQIREFKTTNKIFILHNKGYKKSKKQDYITKPPLDLVDAYLTIFKHSSNNGFNNILIFEDDFICDEKLLDTNITNDICSFIDSKENFVYYLGVIPYITLNEIGNHKKVILGLATHAVIYSSEFIKKSLQFDQTRITDWDTYLTEAIVCFSLKKYMYNKCLCYQPFPETENSQFWGSDFGTIGKICADILKFGMKTFKFDTDPKLGFNFIYSLHK